MLHSVERKNLRSRDESSTRKTPVPSRVPQAKGCERQTAYGNQAVLRMLSLARTGPQTKLAISQPGDRHEPGDAPVQRKCGCQARAAVDEDTPLPEEAQSLGPCGDGMCAACAEEAKKKKDVDAKGAVDRASFEPRFGYGLGQVRIHAGARASSDGGRGNCPACADGALPAHDAYTYTFISRGSYGETTPGFTRPTCAAGAGGASTLVAGSAAPNVNVFPNGTYQVRRNDGVVQTATCTRSAAGLALTQAHENHHAAGAQAGVTAANTAQGLPKNFATPALCAAALPAVATAWNATVNAAWANEIAHGPGTSPPTAQTFTQENAAGTCAFT